MDIIYILGFDNDPTNIYFARGDALERLNQRYKGINFGTGINNIIGVPPNPDDEDFVIVDATQSPPPPPPPAGGRNRIRLLRVTPQELVDSNPNAVLTMILDLFQINMEKESIKQEFIKQITDIIEKIKQNPKTGGKKRFGKFSSRPRRRSSKKRGTQRKQKRRQRRGSRCA